MRFPAIPATLAALALAVGCFSSTNAPDDTGGQLYLFEAEYVNYAWGFVWHGIAVDSSGEVFRFERTQPWAPDDPAAITEGELDAKYTRRQSIGQVDRATLLARVARIDDAALGELTDPASRCADAGGLSLNAFRYDAGTRRYSRVLLRQLGDVWRANRSAAANELADWLRTFMSPTPADGCFGDT